jgi:hypothetical protein
MPVFHPGRTGSFVAAQEAADARRSARTARRSVQELERRLERTLLACEAMWSILRDKLGVTDEDLLNRINEIDLSDGQLDGKVRKPAVACPTCRRTIARHQSRCMYCGQQIMHDPFA